MSVIVTDSGFASDDWTAGFRSIGEEGGAALDVGGDADPAALIAAAEGAPMVRIGFASFADGRGFSLARRLRMAGYAGRLRAAGHVLADQYRHARRSGFDEVEIDEALAARQPEHQWPRDVGNAYLARVGRRDAAESGAGAP
ncbi:DUF934 domain-containing protein [Roseitranquillus sediminis]|uniref:DUF934 domain-containing protein n=1 Tax=Roseitranquillus sediminis TaxID=2809051 RepID=UPI001D0C507D|nr:DUF934 domain-containing protein [Roseitranquillus sediminis]MBM9594180.1 DUF934 domain-containing protein [Roseitranquillus sediminis]